MKVPNVSQRSEVGANMTPMIDVVFLLIIFFLVSSHLARQENRLAVDLPTASSFLPLDYERDSLTITVDADANWRVGGIVIDEAMLPTILQQHSSRSVSGASVRLRTDGKVLYERIEPILREVALAGISDVTISVREKR
ncbi:biopolymer transport protein ExbD [Novipirellula aureliae]|uniref:Biopolymer transport protein ExbD n=1 Tax=Novipirellula aureliae TaxID=2527966 RepID=A0A5C6E0G7_9BACT|nr:biopolymer transporter ExbD [Novipirellula aureliae]TWU43173.1 biopolymer transport protein ExbD [Novipirellula aureliae]